MSIIEPFPEGYDQQDHYEKLFNTDDSEDFCNCNKNEELQDEDGVCSVCGLKYE